MRRTPIAAAAAAAAIIMLTSCTPGAVLPPSPEGVASFDDYYAVTREGAAALPDHTIYRPADLSLFEEKSVPILVWGNGGCDVSNYNVSGFLSAVASRGYIIIAAGAPGAMSQDSGPEGAHADPKTLIDAIDWIESNETASAQLDSRQDLDKIGTVGWSCGGIEALVASADPRVKSAAGLATGFFEEERMGYDRSATGDISVPTLIFHGGPEDIAYENAIATYELLSSPAALVGWDAVGHSGLFAGWNIMTGWDEPTIMIDGANMVADWFDFTLRGSEDAGDTFIGTECKLCGVENWHVETKGL